LPLQLPVLDDRRFADLTAEGRGLIPTFAPEWTNHNPSDPGITLVELFAHMAEMLIYRLDRVTTANIAAFLNLLDGRTRTAEELEARDVAAEIRATVQGLRKLDRAVTAADFEVLALEADPEGRVERARCVPRRDLTADPDRERPGHVSVIILPTAAAEAELATLVPLVEEYLQPRVLLTTRPHVAGPFFVEVTVRVTVVPIPDQTEAAVKLLVAAAVAAFLDPHTGGEDGAGWPFGRNVFVSEVYALVDRLPAVDYVTDVDLSAPTIPADRLIRGPDGRQVGIEVRPHELVELADVVVDVAV
jgi:hypothetical protein